MFIPMLHIKHKGAYGVENLPPTTFLDGVEMSRTTLVYLLNSGAERERETEWDRERDRARERESSNWYLTFKVKRDCCTCNASTGNYA